MGFGLSSEEGHRKRIADPETGLVCFPARYYSPALSRWLTPDPAMDGDHWYAYCSYNPVGMVDPWGLTDIDAIKADTIREQEARQRNLKNFKSGRQRVEAARIPAPRDERRTTEADAQTKGKTAFDNRTKGGDVQYTQNGGEDSPDYLHNKKEPGFCMAMTNVALCFDEAEHQGVQPGMSGYAIMNDAVTVGKVLADGWVHVGEPALIDYISKKMGIQPPVKIGKLEMEQFYLFLGSGSRLDWFGGELRYSGHSQYMTHDGNGGITEFNTFSGWTNPRNISPEYVILYRHAIIGGR